MKCKVKMIFVLEVPTFRGVSVLVGVNLVGGEALCSRAEELRCVAASGRWEAGWNCRLRHA